MDSQQADQTTFWTVQQFWTTPAGKPWYALQLQGDEGVKWQFTGYREEVEQFTAKQGIKAVELPAISEREFIDRMLGRMPQERAEFTHEIGAERDQKREDSRLFWQLPEHALAASPERQIERAAARQQQQEREGFGFSL